MTTRSFDLREPASQPTNSSYDVAKTSLVDAIRMHFEPLIQELRVADRDIEQYDIPQIEDALERIQEAKTNSQIYLKKYGMARLKILEDGRYTLAKSDEKAVLQHNIHLILEERASLLNQKNHLCLC